MLAVPNTIGIKLGDFLQGNADGPLGIGALLLIVLALIALTALRRRQS
jgi:uncharacterized integral membrane protein